MDMKKTFRLQSLIMSLGTLFVLCAFTLSFTSCSDDDDEKGGKNTKNSLTINGEKISTDYATIVHNKEFKGYSIMLYKDKAAYDDEAVDYLIDIEVGEGKTGALLDLTIAQTAGDWFCGIFFNTKDYIGKYWTDEKQFTSGTLRVDVTDTKLHVKAEGVTKETDNTPALTFSIQYDGSYLYLHYDNEE